MPGFVELVRRNREREFRIDAVRADGDPVVCEVLTNVIHGLSRLALGLPSITPALIARLYDEPSGLFLPAVEPAIEERIPVDLDGARPARAARPPGGDRSPLVGYLLDERRFWTAVAPPSVSLDEPSFSLREHFDGLRRYWRGPTWVNSAWLVWRGLVRLGYEQQAADARPRRSPKRSRGRGCASSTTRTTGAAWAPRTSPGRRWRSSCSTRATRAPAYPSSEA